MIKKNILHIFPSHLQAAHFHRLELSAWLFAFSPLASRSATFWRCPLTAHGNGDVLISKATLQEKYTFEQMLQILKKKSSLNIWAMMQILQEKYTFDFWAILPILKTLQEKSTFNFWANIEEGIYFEYLSNVANVANIAGETVREMQPKYPLTLPTNSWFSLWPEKNCDYFIHADNSNSQIYIKGYFSLQIGKKHIMQCYVLLKNIGTNISLVTVCVAL